jgi:hypothetical protein
MHHQADYQTMNASRSASITELVLPLRGGYARPAALFARFEEYILADWALSVLVQIFAVAETERARDGRIPSFFDHRAARSGA